MLDEIDKKIVRSLMRSGRMPWKELASELGLSAPATAERVRRLEEQNLIQSYNAILNPELIGCNLTAFVAVTLERPEHRASFIQKVQKSDYVQECHHIAGDDDYLLKIRCGSTKELDKVISEGIKSLPGVARTRTTIVLASVKESTELPLDGFKMRSDSKHKGRK